jgi:predicted dehydrogenase
MRCEKPLANSIDEAERMVRAARSAAARGVRSMVGYRRVPAAAFARRLVEEGRIGEIRDLAHRSGVSAGSAAAAGPGRVRCARRPGAQ